MINMKELKKGVLSFHNRQFILNEISQKVDDLFTKSFYEYSNPRAVKFYNDTYGVNEIYDNVIQDYLALEKYLTENKDVIQYVDVADAQEDIRFYVIDISVRLGIQVKGQCFFEPLWVKTRYAAYHFASFAYLVLLMLRIPFSREQIETTEKFTILRFKNQFSKTRNFTDIHKEYENPYEKNSIYRLFPVGKRISWVFKSFYDSFGSLREQKLFYKPLVGTWTLLALNNFYKKRIVHAELFKYLIDNYFRHFEGKSYYPMNNLDRFSVIEDCVAKKHNITTYNLPHGIAYGFRYPKGFSSDVFYAYTQSSADVLNSVYSTSKYVYDPVVASKLLKIDNVKPHERHIVFFTEPREVYVNLDIINGLTPMLKTMNWRLSLKLHPGDKKSDYESLDVDFLTDYSEALCGNICISRKSTVLLEAIYNDSIPISIITNVRDQTTFDLFPSLQSDSIIKTHTVEELMEQIIKYYGEEV